MIYFKVYLDGSGWMFHRQRGSRGVAEDCVYAELIVCGYSGAVVGSVGEEDFDSMSYLCGLVYEVGLVTNKSDAKRLKLTEIIAL